MRRTLLITLLLSLSLPTYAEWDLPLGSFTAKYFHSWGESGELFVKLDRGVGCGDWSVGVVASQDGANGNETLKVRINKLAIHYGESKIPALEGMTSVSWPLSDEEEESMRSGGYLYAKYDTRATLAIPLEIANAIIEVIDVRCELAKGIEIEEDVWQ